MYSRHGLQNWTEKVLASCGIKSSDASIAADVLIRANLRGIDTHGISRLPVYVGMLKAEEMNVNPDIRIEERAGAIIFDADRALGQIAGTRAVQHAMQIAQTRAVVAISIRRTGHLGALGVIAMPAAEAGMIAILMQNGPPMMALPGANQPAIGNNPIAFAAPTSNGPPLVFDMAASEVAFGKIIDAAHNKQPIPKGWAIDQEGKATTDATAALSGMLIPTGAHKGLGIAMLVECLAGSLSGVYLERLEPGRTLPAMFGAFLMVINPALLIGQKAFAAHRDAWIERYKASGKNMRYPGERAAQVEAQRARNGISLPVPVVEQLSQLGEKVGVPWKQDSA